MALDAEEPSSGLGTTGGADSVRWPPGRRVPFSIPVISAVSAFASPGPWGRLDYRWLAASEEFNQSSRQWDRAPRGAGSGLHQASVHPRGHDRFGLHRDLLPHVLAGLGQATDALAAGKPGVVRIAKRASSVYVS